MTRTSAVALALLAGTCSAMAAPRETFTYTNPSTGDILNVFGATGASTANGVVVPFTLDGYTTKGVRVTGTLTTLDPASFGNHVRMSIFAPGTSSPLLVSTTQLNGIAAGGTFEVNFAWAGGASAAFPFGMPQTPGNWIITFWDAARNAPAGSPDAQITNLKISMDDDVSPAAVATPLDMTSPSGSIQNDFILGSSVKWYRVTVPAASNTATPPSYFEIFTGGPNTILADSELTLWRTHDAFNGTLTPAAQQQPGARVAADGDSGDDDQAALTFGVGSGLRLGTTNAAFGDGADGNLAAGDYYLAVVAGQYGYFTRLWALFPFSQTPADGNSDINWRSGTRVIAPPSPVTNLGALPLNLTSTGGTADLTAPKWYKFVVGTDIGFMSNDFFDIRTFPGTGTATDTELGLFREQINGILTGTIIVSSDNAAGGNFSRLSFGTGAGDGTLTGGTGAAGGLPAGTYWLAAGNFDMTFATGFITTGGAGPDFDVTFATGSRTPDSNTGIPTNFETLPFPNSGNTTSTTVAVGPAEFKWYKIIVPSALNNTTGNYLDIWTDAVADPALRPASQNTQIILYHRQGRGLLNNDEGPGLYSLLSFGGGAARPAIGTSAIFDNSAGALSADEYYLAVGLSDLVPAFNFVLAPNSTESGSFILNIRSNVAPPGPVCNNPSNVSGPGQNTTAIDAELTADDIIVFLNRFFAGNLLSDVSGPGQNTTAIDGELTADDIIVFLNRFFAGC